MKKRVVLMCVGLLALSLAACGKDGSQESSGQSTEQTQDSGASDSESETGSDTGAGEDGALEVPEEGVLFV